MAFFTAGFWSRSSNSARRKKEHTSVLWNSFMFIVLKHCHVSKFGFDGMVFVTKVVHDRNSSNQSLRYRQKEYCFVFFKVLRLQLCDAESYL